MLSLAPTVRIFLATEPTDMRKGIDGLSAIVLNQWGADVYSGHLFAFVCRRGDRVKVLTWSSGGFGLYCKRLEKGRFRVPAVEMGAVHLALDATQLANVLLDGLDPTRPQKRSRGSTRRPQFGPTWFMAPRSDQDCAWREHAETVENELETLKAQLAALQRQMFGKKSERMPRIADELRKSGASPTDPAAAKAKRQIRAAKRKELPTREIFHAVPEEVRCCPKCGGGDLRALGEGKQSVVY